MPDTPYIPVVTPEALAQTEEILAQLAPWLALAPVSYRESFDQLGLADANELRARLEEAAVHVTRLAIYAQCRTAGYTHECCVCEANKTVYMLRREFGYTTSLDLNF